MMNFEKCTQKSLDAIRNSQNIALSAGNQVVEPIHIFA